MFIFQRENQVDQLQTMQRRRTCRMNRAKLSVACAVGVSFLVLSIGAGRAGDLPPGPNREVVERECQACHDANYFESTNRDRESWNSVIEEMISYGMRCAAASGARGRADGRLSFQILRSSQRWAPFMSRSATSNR
jgi:hypothetical protein